ncbi:death-on-curing family protein [Deinococcus sp. HSC-46F16]|uniref:type II toxin-antitoxin system death-on-curing family toxin n=1 Tax=Deinococcus sp. HSC-46F16 TaxID=2910968 RepID=UPI0020A169A7|nr:type II toxin-antitoxin system death-on-curing family toxin [Deinococcus sp. HSC-46F16]MCP2014446.1 death-on-curing family protein [Deinococcus sp. HSC-46F16]
MKEMSYKDVEDVHWTLVGFFKDDLDSIDPPGVKSSDLLHSAISRPLTGIMSGIGFIYKYTTINHRAAALLHSLIKNHAFYNGNKRTALVSAVRYLDMNQVAVDATEDEYFDLVVDVAKNNYPRGVVGNSDSEVGYILDWFEKRTRRHETALKVMSTQDFLDNCMKMGAKYRESKDGRSFVVTYRRKTVTINRRHRTLQGAVQRDFIKKLGLSRGQTGVRFDEFQDGIDPNKNIIDKLVLVMRRLAAYDREQ